MRGYNHIHGMTMNRDISDPFFTEQTYLTFYHPTCSSGFALPLASTSVPAGFPSPGEDFIEKKLDLNEMIIKHPAATFFVRVQGTSMENAQIFDGDILVVDRSITATSGKIVVAILNGEFTVKRIRIEHDTIELLPENPRFPTLRIGPNFDFQIWGVVTHVIHKTV